jgi:WD40 repeat protein
VKLGEKNGMVMALSLFYQGQSLTLVAGYETGLGTVAQLDRHGNWTVKYQAKCHSQPILSLDISPGRDFFITSSADSIIAKHPLPLPAQAEIRTDPITTLNTKHSGQQSLRIRSDGRIFATAGWDSKIRVYSAKTLKEVAVLKWHQVGCYATAFAAIEPAQEDSIADSPPKETPMEGGLQDDKGQGDSDLTPVPKLVELTVRDKRIREARTAHWLAAGSKDGKVSLWDVF